jgi:hypothetical protein
MFDFEDYSGYTVKGDLKQVDPPLIVIVKNNQTWIQVAEELGVLKKHANAGGKKAAQKIRLEIRMCVKHVCW